jgi:elongation factor Ts
MSEITAAAVKSLRERTAAGLMDCKRALTETGGDEEKAIDLLRQRGAAKAAKRAARTASEGIVVVHEVPGSPRTTMAVVLSETDFVARNEDFVTFAREAAEAAHGADLPLGEVLEPGAVIERVDGLQQKLEDLRASMGENIQLGGLVSYEATDDAPVGSYVHFDNKIGVLVQLEGAAGATDAREVADAIALHIAATNPLGISDDDIPSEVIERERHVLIEQAKGEGKPDQIAQKMVEGRMRKFFEQTALLWQAFVKDQDVSIRDVLERAHPELMVRRFARLEVGG